MQNKTTFKKMSDRLKMICVVVCLALTGSLSAQTVSTASGTNYNGDYSINNPGALLVSFNITNTTASSVALTDVSTQLAPYFSVVAGATSNNKLYASTTSLGGAFDVSSAAWSQVATGTATVPAALAVTNVITGANYIINAGATVRFAIECSNGLAFSVSPTPAPNNFTTGGIILSVGNATATGGNVGYAGLTPVPNPGNTPAFFGGSINVVSTTPCTGAPAPGNTLASATAVCPGVNFNLSLQNNNLGVGITYQWQDSSATTAGAWVNITGATSASLTTSQVIATYYRAAVTCAGSASTTNSNKIFVDKTPQSGCYCDAGALDGTLESISNFTLGTINNASTGTSGYENFTSLSTDLVQGGNYPFDVENAFGFSSDQVIIFIDFNHNGNFTDPGETVYTSANGAGPYIGTLNVPAGALTGPTRLRIRLHDTSFGANPTSCGSSDYGEVEDYTVNIVPCVPLTAIQPSNATVLCGNTATFTLGGTGSFINYQWQQKISATAPWTTVTNGGMFSGANSATLTISNTPASMNGYQYQVLYSGTCTPAKFSRTDTLFVKPFVPTINPATAAICSGSIQKLSITNVSSPVPGSQTTASGAINLAIPDDGTSVGINHTIAATALPVGATVTGFDVKLNIKHAAVGDLVIVLKAPNGKIFSLDYGLTQTGGPGATTGFVNTLIGSDGVTKLVDGTDPWTGLFAPDNQDPAIAGTAPLGADGFIPNTRSYTTFLAGIGTGGNWTLAIYDLGAPDAGILKDWSIIVNYKAPLPETGIWGPVTGGNIFKDAGATIPYDSTQLNTVYVKPTVTTNYTVAVNNGGTCDGTATVPVTVSNPITDATIPVANTATCAGKNASFTAASTTGIGVKHQWYVSTDNGATFTVIPATGAPYGTTAVTGTLTITGATLAQNNYKYKDSLYVTSCASSKFSEVATLTVNPNPVIVLSAAPSRKLYPGLTTTITAAVSPNPASTYSWFRNGIAVPNVTGNKIVVDVDHLGAYTVTVNDVNGCSSTSSAISISDSSNTTLFIYPSPSTGQFQVRYYNNPPANRDGGVPGFVNVFDSKGARVWSKSYIVAGGYTRMDVDLTNLSKGIYRVELTDTKGVRIKTGSVVIF